MPRSAAPTSLRTRSPGRPAPQAAARAPLPRRAAGRPPVSARSGGATSEPAIPWRAASAPAWHVALIGSSGGSTHRGDAWSEVSALSGQLAGIGFGGRPGHGGARCGRTAGGSAAAVMTDYGWGGAATSTGGESNQTFGSNSTPDGPTVAGGGLVSDSCGPSALVVLSCVVYVESSAPLDTAGEDSATAVWVMGLPPAAAESIGHTEAGAQVQASSGAAAAGCSGAVCSHWGSSHWGSSQPGSSQLRCFARGPLHLANSVAASADSQLAHLISRGEIDALVMVSADAVGVNGASVAAAAAAGVPVRDGTVTHPLPQ